MSLSLIVHRGTGQIGGSCIELIHPDGNRLILDAGRPLDAPDDATGLLPATLDLTSNATVLLSHSHQDHWGLISELPPDWPIWAGAGSAALIDLTAAITRKPMGRKLSTWQSRSDKFQIGPFSITPILTDHSAFDAYMLLIEAAGKKVLYSGDFRKHGRKAALVDRLMANPPSEIDVLIIEGTNLGTDKPTKSEAELEQDFVQLINNTKGRVFVSWSGQNIDRTVTLYRAALRTGRTLVVDLYTADVLDKISEPTRLPRAGFKNFKVVITGGLRNFFCKQGRESFVVRMAADGISARALQGGNDVIMFRKGLMRDFQKAGVVPTADDAFNFSMWRGYLKNPDYASTYDWFKDAGSKIDFIHSSGHASPEDLRAFAVAMAPKCVVPVHGENWDSEQGGFGPLRRLGDGERMEIL